MVPGSPLNPLRRIDFGAGPKRLQGYESLDLYHKADIVADIRTMAPDLFAANSLGDCHCSHVIEHLTVPEALRFLRLCQQWIAPTHTISIETPDREKCLAVARLRHTYRDREGILRSSGGCGMTGGRSLKFDDKVKFHGWVTKHIDWIIKLVEAFHHVPPEYIPKQFIIPGEQHLWLWTGEELKMVMDEIGFDARIETPSQHGKRDWRDVRVVGAKKCV